MNLTLESLQEMGAFTGAPVEKEVTWKQNGQELTATVHVRKLSYHSARSDVMAARGSHDGLAGRIAACICDADGQPVFTPEDVTGEADPERGALNDNLVMALLNVIGEVNGLGKTKPPRQRTSVTKRSSGTSS
ncbi:phage tail assembly chaperone family protein, TAC [Halomonas elongata]|uniref:phage tail assembly chaperone family protein, TAC n=1 Tax=Halomonas elongata TaxID=2746 RepID=UPI00186B7A4F|nr:phage tail assembly chaperone family protein, TAC [Halomonas elongata]MBW5800060.1 phage tail assembly chaperone family protein, TAC [Halomonas elongata]